MRAILGLMVVAFAIQQSTPAPQPVFRAGTRLIQVNVVVHDKRGQPIADLKQEDFSLLERGKAQQISFFTVDTATSAASPAPQAPLPSNTFANIASSRADVPTGVTAILVDALNSSVAEQMRTRDGLLKFLKRIEPQDRIAIFAITTHGLVLVHDYTSDSAALVERIRNAKPQVSTTLDASVPDPAMQQDLHNMGLDALADADQRTADFYMEGRINQTLAAFRAIAEHLAGVPGRKSLVWLSTGFPLSIGFDQVGGPSGSFSNRNAQLYNEQLEGVMRVLNSGGIAVYPVDARGVFNPVIVDSSARIPSGSWGQMSDISSQKANTDTMFVLAERTGGRVAYNTNDIGGAVRAAIDDGRVTYTLGYYPADAADDGKWRDIKVTVNRPATDVRARGGYFAMRPADQAADARGRDIHGAVWSPIDSTAIPVTAKIDFTNDPPTMFEAEVHLDTASVSFRHEGDRWKADLDMAFVQKDPHGALQGEGGLDNLAISLTEENYKKVLENGLVHRYHGVRQPAAVTLRIVVRDATTGSVGSVTIPFAQIRH